MSSNEPRTRQAIQAEIKRWTAQCDAAVETRRHAREQLKRTRERVAAIVAASNESEAECRAHLRQLRAELAALRPRSE